MLRTIITHRDEEVGDPPGVESVIIRLHFPSAEAAYQVKDFELLPKLLFALGVATHEPGLAPEHQSLLEVARRQIIRALKTGSELPPMKLFQERLNPESTILRVHLYLPKEVTDPSRWAQRIRESIHLAHEVARSDGS
jgi:hypothetical protein